VADPPRTALVTGANTGIGLAIAERLARSGWSLAFATRSRDHESEAAWERVRAAASGATAWVAGDLADAAVPPRLVEEATAELGPLGALVNNAGLTLSKPALEVTADDFDDVFAVDVRAALLLTIAAAGAMPRGGSVVNVTSVHEHVPREGFLVYGAAKAALGMLTRGFALELAGRGIRVTAVAPGVIASDRNEEAQALGASVPAGRAGTPDEVAAVVEMLLGPDAAYVTGASWVVDGGLLQRVVR
jgi:NAD(P)-dependent dehydrogenase (short-subunit alcohol dehydrogenase family)